MRWPLVTRKTLGLELLQAQHREDDARKHERQIALAALREVRAEADEIMAESLLPFVRKWTHAEAKLRGGDRVYVSLVVPAQTIHELARDPVIADYLGKTLGGQFAVELRHLRLVELTPGKELW